ncbi:hypothetical protein [Sulfurimonas sp.]|jgi:NitT/TauT family transport system substrate-binding protein|uniref:hypothetical protein n=1 Tax=Sulfurimonas sp. TaxID=2022749 RepID=UPI002A35B0B9|nr:hypothetical protein [Sulfurimonas sp.]MDY0123077.1 hypothetical protein [Sulfurimonas sp.]
MLRRVAFIILGALLFISCSSEYNHKLKISATTWIGYTPLFYAKEMGWLEPLNIKLLNVSSLSENMYLYKAGNSDAYVGTQYEYNILSKEDSTLIPVMLFDKSHGGDVIMSNRTLDELTNSSDKIDVYLEMDSINYTLLEDFIKKSGINEERINYINEDQATISTLKSIISDKPTIVVTYSPYDAEIQKKGFIKIASTKDKFDLLVVDAMFTTKKVLSEHRGQFEGLKKAVDRAVVELHKNPREFYEKVKPYILEIKYDEFRESLENIIWINESMSQKLKDRIKKEDFPIEDLI